MTSINTLYSIIALFTVGALIGMYLLSFILIKKETPKIVSYIHGALVGTALVLLVCYASANPGMTEVVVLLLIAASGGVTIIIRDIMNKPLPKWLAIAHGSIAVTGFIFLLVYAFA